MRNNLARLLFVMAASTSFAILSGPGANASVTYGAISVSDTSGRVATVPSTYPTWQDAANAANTRCGYYDCGYVTVWQTGQCGAAARASNGHWGGAAASTLANAETTAKWNAGQDAVVYARGC
ncbi:DUF4189 domain-containing protein [Nocardia sp. NPDC052001]|uniref:DUF4189 domain-containing protein n=1 Tax=Nocardia sp. NPDC052001 TaxID=3154853 RepID=UPI003434C50D